MSECTNLIVRSADVCFGQPRLAGTRLTVFNIVYGVHIDGFDVYTSDYELSSADVIKALTYCKDLFCQKDAGAYCNGCILSSIKEGYSPTDAEEITLIDGSKVCIKGQNIFLGSIEEYNDSQFGQVGWAIAEELHTKYFR